MKNTILILISILIVVYGVLVIISSNQEYAAEKLFYQAAKTNNKIAVNPDVAPPKMLEQVENKLQKILQRYPQSKIAKAAHFTLAEFYWTNKRYEQAHSTLDEIINKYDQDRLALSRAYFLKGLAFEQQNQWDQALREYTKLGQEYSDTALGLGAPLHIANYYKGKERYTQANRAYNEVIPFYKKIEQDNRTTGRGYAAASLLMRAYMELKEYEQAGKLVEDIIDNYPEVMPLVQQVRNIDLIFIKEFNKPEKAIELYNKIKTKTDDPKLLRLLDGQIKAQEAKK